MPKNQLTFVVVENRENETIRNCAKSCEEAGLTLQIIKETNAGDSYLQFSRQYHHLSTNSPAFELICFRRYFLLGNWLEKNNVERFVLIDSDTLLFPGIDIHLNKICSGKNFAGSRVQGESEVAKMLSPHISYWTRTALQDFLGYLRNAYTDDKILKELKNIEQHFKSQNIPGGVTDMSLLYLWSTNIGETTSTNAVYNGAAIDHNITVSDNECKNQYQTQFGFKKLTFEGGKVYATTTDGIYINMLALHFQGKAKLGMQAVLKRQKGGYLRTAAIVTYSRVAKYIYYKLIRN